MNKLPGLYDSPMLSSIYDVLVKHAGVGDDEYNRSSFITGALAWDYNFNFEYRFMGNLGFGGKVWLPLDREPYVTCYSEDETPERRKVINKANEELKRLLDETGAGR